MLYSAVIKFFIILILMKFKAFLEKRTKLFIAIFFLLLLKELKMVKTGGISSKITESLLQSLINSHS